MQNAISQLGALRVKQLVALYARQMCIPDILHIDYVCNACCTNTDLAPNMNSGRRFLSPPEECVQQWVAKFKNGYDERISVRSSRLPGTIPDNAVNTILSAGLNQSAEQINLIIYAHRLSMSAENILGLLLEEFLFSKLSPYGWAMAWGETIRSVDFCNASGSLLQVKNRSNSENSSSSRVREGTQIMKWFRVNANNGRYLWDGLDSIVGIHPGLTLNEEAFQRFIKEVLSNNPNALAIEPNNPWGQL